MNTQKTLKSLLFVAFTAICVMFLWESSILVLVLIAIAFIKHRILPIKIELPFFIISGILGTVAESFVINKGAWSYAIIGWINFPLWLPFLWGLAGIVGVSLFQGLTEK
jgi:hypothetical protein